jgi:hypothetical protein
MACKDCNLSHTGDTELRTVFKGITGGIANDHISEVYIMYTMLFDCMADPASLGPATPITPTITYTNLRTMKWQLELWMNNCSIMFLAQHARSINMASRHATTQYLRMLHMAHKDMGLCDFYMSKMLAALLFVMVPIQVDFIWLHQNFLSLLALWARHEGVYRTTNIDYHCLWRWVMGEPVSAEPLAARTDPSVREAAGAAGGARTYEFIPNDQNHYWWKVNDPTQAAQHMQAKITEFVRSWLLPMSKCMHTDQREYDTFANPLTVEQKRIADSLRVFYHRYCSPTTLGKYTLMTTNEDLLMHTICQPSLQAFEWHFQDAKELDGRASLFANGYLEPLYGNYILLAFARTRTAMERIVPRAMIGRKNVDNLQAKFRLFVRYVDEWLNRRGVAAVPPYNPPPPPRRGRRSRAMGGGAGAAGDAGMAGGGMGGGAMGGADGGEHQDDSSTSSESDGNQYGP